MPTVPLIDPSQNEVLAGLESKSKHPNLFFRAIAHKPAALAAFPALYSAIMGPGAVDRRIKILVYLATSYANNCPYCIWGNEPTARKLGLTDAQLQTLQAGAETGFEAPELAAIRYARELARTSDAAESRRELPAHFSPEQVVELTLVSAMANFTNRVNNGLEILPA